jgi:hypothetical protein
VCVCVCVYVCICGCAHGDQKRTSGVSPALSTDSFEAGTLLDSGGPAILPRLETTKPKWCSYLQLLGSWGDGHSYRHSAWYMHAWIMIHHCWDIPPTPSFGLHIDRPLDLRTTSIKYRLSCTGPFCTEVTNLSWGRLGYDFSHLSLTNAPSEHKVSHLLLVAHCTRASSRVSTPSLHTAHATHAAVLIPRVLPTHFPQIIPPQLAKENSDGRDSTDTCEIWFSSRPEIQEPAKMHSLFPAASLWGWYYYHPHVQLGILMCMPLYRSHSYKQERSDSGPGSRLQSHVYKATLGLSLTAAVKHLHFNRALVVPQMANGAGWERRVIWLRGLASSISILSRKDMFTEAAEWAGPVQGTWGQMDEEMDWSGGDCKESNESQMGRWRWPQFSPRKQPGPVVLAHLCLCQLFSHNVIQSPQPQTVNSAEHLGGQDICSWTREPRLCLPQVHKVEMEDGWRQDRTVHS